jgi:hypothetical protein
VKEALLCGRDLRDLARDSFDSGAGEPPAAIKKEEEVLLKAPERPEGVLDTLDRATRGEDDYGTKVNDIKVNDKVNKVNDRVNDKANDTKVDDIKVGNPGAGFPREGTAHGGPGGPGGERASPYGGPGGGAGILDRDPGITRLATFGVEQDTLLEAGEKQFAAGEISARARVKMKETAEAYLGKKVTHAVVTVPAIACALYGGPGGSGPGGTAGLDYTEVGN